MSVTRSFRDGVRRVNSAPALALGLFGVTLLVALPLSVVLGGMIEAHLGRSLSADTMSTGIDYGWWQEFSAQATGLATTFVPSIVGFGAVLDNLSGLADNQPLAATVVGVTCAWLLIWSFLSGGVIDRFARQRPTRAAGFFAACGTHFWRLARLGLLALLVYYVLFATVHVWLFEGLYPWLTRDFTAERSAFFVRLGLYAVFLAPLLVVNLILDYARIRIVVEDRRSAVAALLAAARFVRRHRGTFGLYLLNTLMAVLLMAVYALAASGSPRSGVRMWLTLAVGQLYIFGRHYTKLLFYASQTAYFQNALAHAAYTAAPAVVWPESPAAEAILNADPDAS